MKRLFTILTGIVLVSYGIMSVFGVNLTYGAMPGMAMDTEMAMTDNFHMASESQQMYLQPCKIMLGGGNACNMTPLDHIRSFKLLFASTVTHAGLLMLSLMMLALAVFKLINFARLKERLKELAALLLAQFKSAPALRFAFEEVKPTPALALFSRLHPRLYA